MNKDLIAIFEHMEREKGIKREVVIQAIEDALLMAARRTLREDANVTARINPRTGDIDLSCEKEIVDKVQTPSKEISLLVARELDPDCEIGQYLDVPITLANFGRIAAQAARQVISQRIRGAERDVIHEEFRHRVNELVSGVVKRLVKGANLIIDLGKVEAMLPMRNYPKTESYHVGNRVYSLLLEVRDLENGGAEVILTRSHPEFVRQLFLQEVPELEDQTVSIVKIVRDPGYRTKLIVRSNNPKVDPVGACVGVRGARVKNIIHELNNEKIDIIPYNADPVQLLQNILSPIEIKKIAVNEEEDTIAIVVEDSDFPAVIGKRGMNARLTSELLGYELEVQRMSEYNKLIEIQRMQLAESKDPRLDAPLTDQKLNKLVFNKLVVQNLEHAGLDTLRKLLLASVEQIAEAGHVSLEIAYKILDEVSHPFENGSHSSHPNGL